MTTQQKQSALLRILKATVTLPAQVTFYASALGAIALVPGADLPPALATIAAGVGVNALTSILERVARGEQVSDDEIRQQVKAAIDESRIAEELATRDTQVMIARLFRRHDVLRFTIQNNEYVILQRLTEQAEQRKAFFAELRSDISVIYAEIQKLATRQQMDEVITLLQQLDTPPIFRSIWKELETGWPTEADFREGRVFDDEPLREEVLGRLRLGKKVVVIGKPSSGKTVFARSLGRYLVEHENYQVYYHDARMQKDPYQWLRQINQNKGDRVLFIIDNCHSAAAAVSDLVKLLTSEDVDANILLLSRKVDWRLIDRTPNYFEMLEDSLVEIRATEESMQEAIGGIAGKYSVYYKTQTSFRGEIGDVQVIARNCGYDLSMLKSLLDTWLYFPDSKLEDVGKDSVYDHLIRRKKWFFPTRRKLLMPINALHQLEVAIQAIFFQDSPLEVEQLMRDGLLEEVGYQDYGLCYIPQYHSSFARLWLDAAHYCRALTREDTEIVAEYLLIGPSNYGEVIRGLYQSEREDALIQLVRDDDVVKAIAGCCRESSLFDMSGFLRALAIAYSSEEDRERVAKIIERANGFDDLLERAESASSTGIYWFLHWLRKALERSKAEELIRDFLEGIDPNTLAAKSLQESFFAVANIDRVAKGSKVSESWRREFFRSARNEDLITLIGSARTSFAAVHFYIKDTRNLDRSKARELIQGIGTETLAEMASRGNASSLRGFLRMARGLGVEPDWRRQLCNEIGSDGLRAIIAKPGKLTSLERLLTDYEFDDFYFLYPLFVIHEDENLRALAQKAMEATEAERRRFLTRAHSSITDKLRRNLT
jgi:hypothetical protein